MTPQTHQEISEETALFPIGTVSEQTGVNSVTLRAWERRYGLLKPRRTPKGHRLYSPHDVERIRQVLTLLDQGIPVGRVRDIIDTQSKRPVLLPLTSTAENEDPWRHYRQLFLRWIHKLDARSLEHAFNEATSLYSLELVAKKLLLPLYQQLQRQRADLPSTSADHAFLHEFLCAKLGSRYLHNNSRATNGKHLLLLNMRAEESQVETLLMAAILSNHGYQISVLGNGITLDHLPLILQRTHFDALLMNGQAETPAALMTLLEMKNIPVFLPVSSHSELPDEGHGYAIHALSAETTEMSLAIDNVLLATEETS